MKEAGVLVDLDGPDKQVSDVYQTCKWLEFWWLATLSHWYVSDQKPNIQLATVIHPSGLKRGKMLTKGHLSNVLFPDDSRRTVKAGAMTSIVYLPENIQFSGVMILPMNDRYVRGRKLRGEYFSQVHEMAGHLPENEYVQAALEIINTAATDCGLQDNEVMFWYLLNKLLHRNS